MTSHCTCVGPERRRPPYLADDAESTVGVLAIFAARVSKQSRRSRGKSAMAPRIWASYSLILADHASVLVQPANPTGVLFRCTTPANRAQARPRNANFTLPQNRR